jgi:spermidine/putrescine transport system substrate-binding protein
MNRRRYRLSQNRAMRSGLTRRQFIGRAGVATGAIVLTPSLLAACGGDDDDVDANEGGENGGGGADKLVISNWPLYIDPTEDGVTGSVDLFKEETGIDLRYTDDFNDNNEFFAKIQPDLAAGNVINQDIIVPSSWLAKRLIDLGWVDELPLDEIPNVANQRADLRNPVWDPEGKYSLPWQSGITGIAYNIDATGRELTSMDDLFDEAFKGKIGFLLEMRDSVGLLMLADGKDVTKPTFADAQASFDRLEEAANNGQIRAFTGNDYQDDLVAGNFVACVGWSGDIAQLSLDEPSLRFVIPDSGGMTWTDTQVMPKGAPNRAAAAEWMNYCYDPANAARIEAYIGYISPVEGVREEFLKNPDWEAYADLDLMFPDEAMLSQTHQFGPLDEEESAQFDERYAEITEG